METAVADTSALVSLAVPRADPGYDETPNPDPLQLFLTAWTVFVPTQVQTELEEMATYDDIHGTAAQNVLAANSQYATENPLDRADAPESLPEFGLDAGETAAIVLANDRDVDALFTDEFAGPSVALIHARLAGVTIVTTPRFLRDYAHAGFLSADEADAALASIASHRSWEHSAYVENVREQLAAETHRRSPGNGDA